MVLELRTRSGPSKNLGVARDCLSLGCGAHQLLIKRQRSENLLHHRHFIFHYQSRDYNRNSCYMIAFSSTSLGNKLSIRTSPKATEAPRSSATNKMTFQGRTCSFSRPGSLSADGTAEYPASECFLGTPNELKFMFADRLEVVDVNALARTSRALHMLLSRYIYRRAKSLVTTKGRPFFLVAADLGNVTAVKQFIEVGTSANLRDSDQTRIQTALHSCALFGHMAAAQLLIEAGADILAVDKSGRTALHMVASSRDGSYAMMKLLIDAGADISAIARQHGSVLHTAATNGTSAMVQLLLDHGAATDTIDEWRETPLHGAAFSGSGATVRLLLRAGAEIEANNAFRWTALHSAALAGNAECVEALLEAGANVGAGDQYRNTPLHLALKSQGNQAVAHLILQRDSPELIPAGLDDDVVDAEADCVPPYYFLEKHKEETNVIEMLLDAGADIRAANDRNNSPLTWANIHARR
jgi:ankyrin repeat protein